MDRVRDDCEVVQELPHVWIKVPLVYSGRGRRRADAIQHDCYGEAPDLLGLTTRGRFLAELAIDWDGLDSMRAALDKLVWMLDCHPAPARTVADLDDLAAHLDCLATQLVAVGRDLDWRRRELLRVLCDRGAATRCRR